MPKSYRSCQAVLDLVNQICRDQESMTALFGESLSRRWQWEEHVSAKPEMTGEAYVEVVPAKDTMETMVKKMCELGIGEKMLTCAVLLRTGEQVRKYADGLRSQGFDVIEEGHRQPVKDHPVGVALLALMTWLADPGDQRARGVVSLSPLEAVLSGRFGEHWQAAWEGLLAEALEDGYASMMDHLVAPLWVGLSEFGRSRVKDLTISLKEFDRSGEGGIRAARDWISGLEVAQAPGAAAIQVMTIHKSKGLGFDVVFIPELSDKQVPDMGYFQIARGPGWVMQAGCISIFQRRKIRMKIGALSPSLCADPLKELTFLWGVLIG